MLSIRVSYLKNACNKKELILFSAAIPKSVFNSYLLPKVRLQPLAKEGGDETLGTRLVRLYILLVKPDVEYGRLIYFSLFSRV